MDWNELLVRMLLGGVIGATIGLVFGPLEAVVGLAAGAIIAIIGKSWTDTENKS